MIDRRLLHGLVFLGGAFAFVAHADTTVSVIGPAVCRGPGNIIATPANEALAPILVPLRAGTTVRAVTLPESTTWMLRGDVAGCWSETRVVSSTDSDVTLSVFQTATVTSVFAAGSQRAARLRGTILRGDRADAADCRVADARWSCAVPAGVPFALRVDPEGFAALYYWDLRVEPAITRKLEPRALKPGASLAGWLENFAGHPLAGAPIKVQPLNDHPLGVEKHLLPATTTDQRGFFQIAGLEAGEYLLIATPQALSAASVVVRLRGGQSLLWPQPIRAMPPATVNIILDPPLHRGSQPWVLELAEDSPLDRSKPALRKAATTEGRWSASGLRATTYALSVRNDAGSILEQVPIDVSAGGAVTLPLTVHAIMVRGSITAGDDPLSADLTFTNERGIQVRAVSDQDGSFEAEFPALGGWRTRVRYPRGSSSRIDASAIEIDSNASTVRIRLPGGRVKGSVVTLSGDRERAAVHLFRDRAPVAQQITSDDGAFDLVGIGEGDYTMDAAGPDGMTPAPVPLHVDRDETREVKLTVEPFRLVRGTVVSPSGGRALGAAVRVSTDDGFTWFSARVENGAFEYRVPRNIANIQLLVLSYAYPVSLRALPVTDEDIVVALQPAGGFVNLTGAAGRAFIRNAFASAPLNAFQMGDGVPVDFNRIYLEPGAYTVCPGPLMEASCREVMLQAGSDLRVNVGRGDAL